MAYRLSIRCFLFALLQESFYNVASGIIILIGAILFAVSTGKIARNKCETKTVNETMFKITDLCDKYFLDSNKYVAVVRKIQKKNLPFFCNWSILP